MQIPAALDIPGHSSLHSMPSAGEVNMDISPEIQVLMPGRISSDIPELSG